MVLTYEAGVRQETGGMVVVVTTAGAVLRGLAVVLELSPAGPGGRQQTIHHYLGYTHTPKTSHARALPFSSSLPTSPLLPPTSSPAILTYLPTLPG